MIQYPYLNDYWVDFCQTNRILFKAFIIIQIFTVLDKLFDLRSARIKGFLTVKIENINCFFILAILMKK